MKRKSLTNRTTLGLIALGLVLCIPAPSEAGLFRRCRGNGRQVGKALLNAAKKVLPPYRHNGRSGGCANGSCPAN